MNSTTVANKNGCAHNVTIRQGFREKDGFFNIHSLIISIVKLNKKRHKKVTEYQVANY